MKFTFAYCAAEDGRFYDSLFQCIETQIPKDSYEILWISGREPTAHHRGRFSEIVSNFRYIPFDEHQRDKGWITRKKNILAQEAQFENIVFLHDYFRIDADWYKGWQAFGEDFEIAINPVLMNGSLSGDESFTYRHADWLVDPFLLWDIYPHLHWKFWDVALPYEYKGLTKIQYISGGYWVAKKEFMLQHPLNEELLWGDAEDIEWSRRVREITEFKFNFDSHVWVIKNNKWKPGIIPPEYLDALVKKHNLEIIKDDSISYF